jgi:hypothetical protein
MIVAVIAVRMMQVAVDQIVDMIAMRHRLMPAAGTMHMSRIVSGAAMIGRAHVGIDSRYFDHMLVDVIPVHMMKMPIVEIIDMIAMPYRRVSAIRTMLMGVVLMMWMAAFRHGIVP